MIDKGITRPKPIDEPWFFIEVLFLIVAGAAAFGIASGVLPLMLIEWLLR